jgi:hypothetical protein
MKTLIAFAITLLVLVSFIPTAQAQGPSPVELQTRLEQEPGLRCIAADVHVSNESVARFKLATDYLFGYKNQVVTDDQWQATWFNRWQFISDILGVTNPMFPDNISGAHPSPGCRRLIDAQQLLEMQ